MGFFVRPTIAPRARAHSKSCAFDFHRYVLKLARAVLRFEGRLFRHEADQVVTFLVLKRAADSSAEIVVVLCEEASSSVREILQTFLRFQELAAAIRKDSFSLGNEPGVVSI